MDLARNGYTMGVNASFLISIVVDNDLINSGSSK